METNEGQMPEKYMIEQLEWLDKRGSDMLNSKIMLINTDALLAWWGLKHRGTPSFFASVMFIRPVDRMKYFRGQRWDRFEFMHEIARRQQFPKRVIVSPQRGLFSTWNVLVENHMVMNVQCTRSAYKDLHYDGLLVEAETAEPDSYVPRDQMIVEKAAAELAAGWLPWDVCTMQIARIHGKFKIIDFEPLSASDD